jgi:transposase InsO family protein
MEWAAKHQIHIQHIQPGKPQQNAYVERFNRTVRYEWLSQHYWESINEVQEFVRIPAQRDRPFQQYDRSFQIDRDR